MEMVGSVRIDRDIAVFGFDFFAQRHSINW